MATINPKLNLNKTPNLVEPNSLIFAKNIRLDVDGTIHRDYGITKLSNPNPNLNGNISATDIIKKIRTDVKNAIDGDTDNELPDIYNIVYDALNTPNNGFNIVGQIAYNTEFYIFIYSNIRFIHTPKDSSSTIRKKSFIIKYDEKTNTFTPCNCNWNYSGGKISGHLINNLRGEKILIVGETNTTKLIPLKCINLNYSDLSDDENNYTQTPKIPITNINYIGEFGHSIPNGVYQFFVRYKTKHDFYTDWMPASRELFAGNTNISSTSFGVVKYLNTHLSSDNSFIFSIEHLNEEVINNYESFQIGFIVSNDDAVVARAWKHFTLDKKTVYFDYKEDGEEIEVIDLIKPIFQIYNVGNITNFKNKLYISNYTETNYNEDLSLYASKVTIELAELGGKDTYNGYIVDTKTINGIECIKGLKLNENDEEYLSINDTNGIIYDLFRRSDDEGLTIASEFKKAIVGENFNPVTVIAYGISLHGEAISLESAQDEFKNNMVSSYGATNKKEENLPCEFSPNISDISIYLNSDSNSFINLTGVENAETKIDNIINEICKYGLYINPISGFVNKDGRLITKFTCSVFRPVIAKIKHEISAIADISNIPEEDIIDDKYYWYTIATKYRQNFTIEIHAFTDNYISNDSTVLTKYTTLIPHQSYNFYIHFVKDNGETTNGFYCGSATPENKEKVDAIIYPTFRISEIPNNYSSCFFSIVHTENNVSTITDIVKTTVIQENENIEGFGFEAACIDINLFNNKVFDNIIIESDKNIANNGKFYFSSDYKITKFFGNRGVLTFDNIALKNDDGEYIGPDVLYAISQFNINNSENIELTKCTPYIKLEDLKDNTYNSPKFLNLLGYISKIYLLNYERTSNYYSDGTNNVYIKVGETLKELNKEKQQVGEGNNIKDGYIDFGLITEETTKFVYSNYNLNYLNLTEDIKQQFVLYGTETPKLSKTLRVFSSLNMSQVYTLPSMYKNYTRKIYSKYKKDEVTRFDNTIRSSMLEGDENTVNVFKFHPNDYYNVPTNRGIITNLIAIGDSILVHTEDSLFRFSGSNTIQSSDGEILPTEGEPFDTGIAEVFGSDFGFAGLKDKEHSILCELGYIYFDADSRIVYMYSGQGQLAKLSDSIEKLFRHRDINSISFANDYYNNRIFMCIKFVEGETTKPVTLSFSVLENIKSFISLHDFYFDSAFNTKVNCYFLHNAKKDIYFVNKNYNGYYSDLTFNDTIYPSKKNDLKFDSIIDIIVNNDFETIKTLNAVNWCSNNVDSEFTDIDDDNIVTLKMAEDINATYPCKAMRIYTDTCITPLFDFSEISNNYSIDSSNSYKYPRYNQGFWTFNYFRNIQKGTNESGRTYNSDQNSLVEGKYFVVRFLFSEPFKLETLTLNYDLKR